MRTSIFAICVGLFAFSAMADFLPVPVTEGKPLRVQLGASSSNTWQPMQLKEIGGYASAVYGVGGGFDVGFGLQGTGVNNSAKYSGVLQGDLMLRFVGTVTDIFFIGLQAVPNFKFNFSSKDMGAHLSAGLPMGVVFPDVISVYVLPAVELGDRIEADPTNTIWGNAIGVSLAAGVGVQWAGLHWVAQAKPWVQDWSNWSKTFRTDFMLGLAMDI